MRIRAVVTGAAGRMGRQVLAALSREPDVEVVGGVDIREQKVPVDPDRGERM
ncbi:MAG: 4-hydroxy-tetrahydrodipicolinate reductase, partial [Bacillota bacterium]